MLKHLSQVTPLIHSVHVYQSSEQHRDRRNSLKLQHSASVTCILLGPQMALLVHTPSQLCL